MVDEESLNLKAVYNATFAAFYDKLLASDATLIDIGQLQIEYNSAIYNYAIANTNAVKAEIALQVAKGILDAAVRFDKKF